MTKQLILFTDIGDTIIDEGTEIREAPGGVVHRADCIPGTREAMLRLYEEGYVIAMVADGLVQSFRNTMSQNGLSHIFAAKAISETVGAEKPDERMFRCAMDALNLTDADKRCIIMVGNNVERDIAGANRFGIRSVQLIWSERHPTQARCPEELADYQIHAPEELCALVNRLNEEMEGEVR